MIKQPTRAQLEGSTYLSNNGVVTGKVYSIAIRLLGGEVLNRADDDLNKYNNALHSHVSTLKNRCYLPISSRVIKGSSLCEYYIDHETLNDINYRGLYSVVIEYKRVLDDDKRARMWEQYQELHRLLIEENGVNIGTAITPFYGSFKYSKGIFTSKDGFSTREYSEMMEHLGHQPPKEPTPEELEILNKY